MDDFIFSIKEEDYRTGDRFGLYINGELVKTAPERTLLVWWVGGLLYRGGLAHAG